MTSPKLSRRNFLKLASLVGLSALAPKPMIEKADQPNILIVVFDAWTAENVGMFGYQRDTMPLLSKLAEEAIVFHRHYAAGPWTIPGTASLLTGTYPWTHRVFNSAQYFFVTPKRNIFQLFQQAGYTTAAATHNLFAYDLLFQLRKWLDHRPPYPELFLPTRYPITNLFSNDIEAGALAQIRAFLNREDVHSALFLGEWLKNRVKEDQELIEAEYGHLFPRGVPATPVPYLNFLLEEGIDHLMRTAGKLPDPLLAYYHYYPPHQPYNTRREFSGRFEDDGLEFPRKPLSLINEDHTHREELRGRRDYDEFLGYVDAEFHRLYTRLKSSGQLDNTWLILTSDHGELFERGNIGHEAPQGYEPEIHVPLLIFPPGQTERVDIHTLTNAVDVLPTLLHLIGEPVPEWVEGKVLPPFKPPKAGDDRTVFTHYPGVNVSRSPMNKGTITAVQGDWKLIYTFGIPELEDGEPHLELYDRSADPEELNDLYTPQHPVGKRLLDEITTRLEKADQPYH
jgi:arylsulfatase A-like enzyme